MDTKLDIGALYNTRMLIYLESEPQSNKYFRIMLDAKQYAEVTKAVYEQFPKDPEHACDNPSCAGVTLLISDETIPLPDVSEIHACQGECTC